MLESGPYTAEETPVYETVINLEEKIAEFEEEMREAAESLEFERAANLRDRIAELREKIAGWKILVRVQRLYNVLNSINVDVWDTHFLESATSFKQIHLFGYISEKKDF